MNRAYLFCLLAGATLLAGVGAVPAARAGGPANDDCANAILVTDGILNFSTVGASTDGPAEPGVCNFFGYTQVGADVWFRYIATCDGNVVVDLCNSNFDTKVAVYENVGCPITVPAIACNDDACGAAGIRSRVSFPAVISREYVIRVGGYNGATGPARMVISCIPDGPANDFCVNATPVGNGTTPFTTVGATTDGPLEDVTCNFAGDSQVGADIWFFYSAPCTDIVTVRTCGSLFDTKLAVYAGPTCPTGPTALACNDDSCGGQSEVQFSATAGSTYYIRVGGYNGASGAGALSITCPLPECPGEKGDANCDATIDFFDIDPFLLALFDPIAYAAANCSGSVCAADVDCSGLVDFFDIDPFLACLFGTCPPCP